jgi:hypothetical protein
MGTVSMIDILALCSFQLPWRDANQAEERLLREVLRDTRPGEPIADTHGETVFRPRPSYYVLEDVTESRLADGLLRDRTVADVARTRTHFAVADNPRFPTGARQFLNMHYLTIGALRALGSDLGDRSATGEGTSRFDVSYPERFVVVADGAPGRGELDGVRYRGPILLQAGTHAYARSGRENHVQVIWAGAVERGLVTETPLREVD